MTIRMLSAFAIQLVLATASFAADSSPGTTASVTPEEMKIYPNGTQPSGKVLAQYFSGPGRVDPLFPGAPSTRTTAASVTFEPGTHSVWHTHPAGQLLIVTNGIGWVQEAGKAKQTIRTGDVVWTPPGVKHWHGATNTNAMGHIAIQDSVDGKNVDWQEAVTTEQYLK